MRKLITKRPLCTFSVFFAFIVYIMLSISGGIDMSEYESDGNEIIATGYIYNKSSKNYSDIIYLDKCREDAKLLVYIKSNKRLFEKLKIGQKITIKGEYDNFDSAENEGQFDKKRYYRIRKIEAKIKDAEIISTSREYAKLRNALYEIRKRTEKIYESYLSNEQSGIMDALVLGDKDDLDAEIKDLYQDAGIAHILSLSGLHIATVGMCIVKLLRKSGIGIGMASFISILLMLAYGIMTGMSTSTIRALIMFMLALLAKTVGRTYDLLTAVSFSAILMLLENALYIYDSGFLLSISSVLGIGLFYPMFATISDNSVFKALCVSLSTFISTLPVVMQNFYKVSIYGVFLNLFVVPVVGVLLFCGLLAGFIGNVLYAAPFGDGIQKVLFFSINCILCFYEFMANFTTGINGNAWVTGASSTVQIVIYIIMLSMALFAWKGVINSESRLLRITPFILIIMAVGAISIRIVNPLEIQAISVGQGACNFITGKNIPAIMVDGGSSDVKNVFKYRISPVLLYNGIDTIDYLFVTHPDEDHISGVKELLSDERADIRIKHLFLSVKDGELCKLAGENNVSIHYMQAGDKIEVEKLLIECINPDLSANKKPNDINDASLVLKVTHKGTGFTSLFTGDISSDAEMDILERCNVDENIDYMTVAHHGSKYSSSEEFLDHFSPSICTISAGRNNSYGHPHRETLERLGKCIPDSKVLRTDKCGQITVIVKDDKINIKKYAN